MELTSSISLGIGILDAKNKLADIKDNLKSQYLGYDKCFNLLNKISIEVIEKNTGRKITLGQSVRIINSLKYHLLKGDEVSIRQNLTELLNIDNQKLHSIISDFEDKIINSKSLELITLINLSQSKRLETIDSNVKLIIDKFSDSNVSDSDNEEIIVNLKELLISSFKNGDLKNTLQRIDLLTIDGPTKFPHFKDFLVLLQSKVILKIENSERYRIQLKSLSKISSSFKKFYYMLLFYKKLYPKVSIDIFIEKTVAYQFERELSTSFLLLEDKNYSLNSDDFFVIRIGYIGIAEFIDNQFNI